MFPPAARVQTYVRDLGQDLRYGLRLLLRAPGFAVVSIVTLALGIGASTSMFTIVDSVLFRPLSFAEPHRLVIVRPSSGSRLSQEYLYDWRTDSRTFLDMAGWHDTRVNLTGTGSPVEILADRVTPNFFTLLGVPPVVGRSFTSNRNLNHAEAEVVLSYGLWQRRFGGDRAVVGQAITLGGETFTVVGVMPQGFAIRTTELSESRAELWMPFALIPGGRDGMGGNLHVVGRLVPGVTAARAQSELAVIARRIETAHPSYSRDWTVGVIPLLDATVMDVRLTLLVLFGAVGVLLLMACANVANLVLSRAVKRQTEVAIRLSLGATGGRLVRQFASEALVLAALGGALGVLLAIWGSRGLVSAVPAGFELPRTREISVDLRVLTFAILVMIAAAFVAGAAPSLGWLRPARVRRLQVASSASAPMQRTRLSQTLIVSEVALAIVLLSGAGLLVRSVWALHRVDPGFEPEGVVTMRITLPDAIYATDDRLRIFSQQLLERIERLPGIRAVGTVNYLPMSRFGAANRFEIEGRPDMGIDDQKFSLVSVVGGRYFAAMGIPLRRGRLPGPSNHDRTRPVVVIDEELARRFWPNEDPIGARLTWQTRRDDTVTGEIIGVVGSVRWRGLATAPEATTYFWFPQDPGRELTIVARSVGNPADLAASVSDQVAAVDPNQPVADIRLMRDMVAEDLARPRFTMLLLVGFAAVALLLTMIGLYGLISFTTAQRTREIGIRMALGAQRRDVLRLVMQGGLRMAVAGIVLGLVATLALGRSMTSLIYGIRPADPITLIAVTSVVTVVALLATYVPGRRATRLDPVEALGDY
jgi:putative ABC transport system permease protein